MKQLNMKRSVGLLTVLSLSSFAVSPALAAPTQFACANGDITRSVEINEPGEGGFACEVIYRKPNEGQPGASLWRAQNDLKFCRARAEELTATLVGAGWNCAEVGASSATETIEAVEPAAPEPVAELAPEEPIAEGDAIEAPMEDEPLEAVKEAATEAAAEVDDFADEPLEPPQLRSKPDL